MSCELGAAILLGSQVGARLHSRIWELALRRLFTLVLVVAAAWMLLKAARGVG